VPEIAAGRPMALLSRNGRDLGLGVEGGPAKILWRTDKRVPLDVWGACLEQALEDARARGIYSNMDWWTARAIQIVRDGFGGRWQRPYNVDPETCRVHYVDLPEDP